MKNEWDISGTLKTQKEGSEMVNKEEFVPNTKAMTLDDVRAVEAVLNYNDTAWLLGSRLCSMVDLLADNDECLEWGYWFLDTLQRQKRLLPIGPDSNQHFLISDVKKIQAELDLFPDISNINSETIHSIIDAFDCPFGLDQEIFKHIE